MKSPALRQYGVDFAGCGHWISQAGPNRVGRSVIRLGDRRAHLIGDVTRKLLSRSAEMTNGTFIVDQAGPLVPFAQTEGCSRPTDGRQRDAYCGLHAALQLRESLKSAAVLPGRISLSATITAATTQTANTADTARVMLRRFVRPFSVAA